MAPWQEVAFLFSLSLCRLLLQCPRLHRAHEHLNVASILPHIGNGASP